MVMRMIFLLFLAVAATGCSGVIADSESGTPRPDSGPTIEEEPAATPSSEPATEEPTPAPADEPAATPTAAPEVEAPTLFCPDIPRPAQLIYVPDEGHLLLDASGDGSCELTFLDDDVMMPQIGGSDIFYVQTDAQSDGERLGVYRVRPDGEQALLPAASVLAQDGTFPTLSYVVSDDGTTLAWTISGFGEENQLLSDLLAAPVSTDADLAPTALVSHTAEQPRALKPIRFSADNSVLFYTIEPVGIGGSWLAFTGRYDNLYAVPTAGGPPTLIFDCQSLDQGLGLCIGDFQVANNQVVALAYTDSADGSVVIVNGEGQELNRFAPGGDYVGSPRISPDGQVIFYSAELPDESIVPETATIHRVAPPTAPSAALVSASGIVLPHRFLNDQWLIVGYAHGEMTWGLALVSMTGELQILQRYPDAVLVDVAR